tara:strand:+ start:1115 stop:1897 length:783 start_codon:yes stop_codon:yes gene_type:complete
MIKPFAFLIFITLACFSNTPIPIDTLLDGQITNDFISYQVNGTLFDAHQNKTLPFRLTLNSNDQKGLYVDVKNPLCISELHLSPSFEVQSSTFNITNDDLAKRLKYDFRTGHRNEFEEVVFNFKKNKKTTRKKGIYYTKKTIDTFSLIPIFQVLAAMDVVYISADLAVENRGIKVPIFIKKETVNELGPYLTNYTLHNEFENIIKNSNERYIVFKFKVGSWQGLIYNYRHYYVFSATPPYKYKGHWGGPDKMNLVSWVID